MSLFDRVAPDVLKLLEQLEDQTPSSINPGLLQYERKVEEGILRTVISIEHAIPRARIYVVLVYNEDYAKELMIAEYKGSYPGSSSATHVRTSEKTVKYIRSFVERKSLADLRERDRYIEQLKIQTENLRKKYVP